MKLRPLFWKIYPFYILIIIISLILTSILALREMRRIYLNEVTIALENQALLIKDFIGPVMTDSMSINLDQRCKQLGQSTKIRITIVNADGTVLGDSNEDPATMENHGGRPEIRSAYDGQTGVSTRYSSTLRTSMMYVAIPVSIEGELVGVVRTSMPISAINDDLESFYGNVIIGGLIIMVIAALVGSLIFRRFTRPIRELQKGAEQFARGELMSKLPVADTEEIAALALSMNRMAEQLDNRIRTIIEQRNEREAILSSMSEGVLAIDNQEKIVSFNRAAADFLNLDIKASTGKPIREVARIADLHELIELTSGSNERVEMEIILPGQNPRYLQAHGSVLSDASGNGIGILLVFNDITRIKKLENIRREFVANVSHELKTPITSIIGSAETLVDDEAGKTENSKKFLSMIIKNADRLNSLVDDLLSLARLESETDMAGVKLTACNIAAIMESAIEACHHISSSKGIKTAFSVDKTVIAKVNRIHLEQAVINLIDNAVKYSESGTTISISAGIINNELVISVEDHGCGIESRHLPHLFERFYRVDKGRSREIGGTGLGLAIVKHVALAHNGRVSVDSIPGKGSIFRIHLPL